MILRRLGNKKKIAKEIQKYFPPHKIYIEPFFGAGGMFFNKPLSKYNLLNDNDSDVFNLFIVLKENKKELYNAIEMMPVSEDLFKDWKTKEEKDPIWKAVRFLFLSNFGFQGMPDSLHLSFNTSKKTLLNNIEKTYNKIIRQDYATTFTNVDFRELRNKIVYQKDGRNDELKTFIYSDPPYLDTGSNYKHKGWMEKDSFDCFELTFNSGLKGAMSEFNHPFVLEEAKRRNLNIINIGERHNIRNKRTEILVTNYSNSQQSLF